MPKAITLHEQGPEDFLAELRPLANIYGSAMDADRLLLPGRRELMRQHTGQPAFRAIVARGPRRGVAVAFAYGFHGTPGQWWYDCVQAALIGERGYHVATEWLTDCMEIAEVHVHPRYQRQGIGTRMLMALTAGRPEPAVVLSTPDRDTTARRLYNRLGFSDLLTGYRFPGGGPPYALMGAALPLRDAVPAPDAPQSASPSIW